MKKDVIENREAARNAEDLVDEVRERYARFGAEGSRCCSGDSTGVAERLGYSADELASIPEAANLGLGCGAPVELLDLKPGETVVDLGSGGGLDAFLAAPKVGTGGEVIGIDMTPEMIERARDNARRAGLSQVEFREGRLERLPVEDASVDAVTSNCVINLVPDKSAVFREVARVLRPGGRLVVSDIVLDGPLPEALEQDLLAYVGCIAGAMQRDAYLAAIREAGLGDVEILKDTDIADLYGDKLPDDAADLVRRTGITLEEIRGKVRSVTYRAIKTG